MSTEPTDINPEEQDLIHADLAALADGSLPAERSDLVTRRIESSPELAQGLVEQRQMVALLNGTRPSAPASLHHTVQAMVAAESSRRSSSLRARRFSPALLSRRPLLAGGGALASVALLAVVLVLTGGGQKSLTLGETAALGLRSATVASPAENPSDHSVLTSAVDGISYPYWGKRFGFKTAGARTDRLRGRTITTVFYSNARAERVGYSIVDGRAIAIPKSKVLKRGGVTYWALNRGGATILTWRRDGHTCILTSRGADSQTLLALARWHES